MTITHILLLPTILALASCQKLPPNALASLMQDILSPTCANSKIAMRELPINRRSVVLEAGLPRNGLAKQILVQNPAEAIPRNIIVNQRNELAKPTKIIVQKQNEVLLPNNVVLQANDFVIPTKVVMQNVNDLPRNVVLQNPRPKMIVQNGVEKVLVKNPEGVLNNRKILLQKTNEIPMLKNLLLNGAMVNQVPNSAVVNDVRQIRPAALNMNPKLVVNQLQDKVLGMNPYLPAASPVSPVVTANATPQSRGQYLRKIPIPPPTI